MCNFILSYKYKINISRSHSQVTTLLSLSSTLRRFSTPLIAVTPLSNPLFVASSPSLLLSRPPLLSLTALLFVRCGIVWKKNK
ncbi:hypothetical protein LWI28_006324 [Acer negundo]|uniref:Uncharacterized protein n=1 Tax=Acer negundo TaxID=4023 RepID=A0AAD5IYU2_ACENE|nr:hypothetical protein LWI28_006324 [Acer negundo]KAK4845814.1 hypothetical protein QYF36_009382 [Acer negundo]